MKIWMNIFKFVWAPDKIGSNGDLQHTRRRGANRSWEAPIYEIAKFSEKLHEIEKISGRGERPLRPPKSATVYISYTVYTYIENLSNK